MAAARPTQDRPATGIALIDTDGIIGGHDACFANLLGRAPRGLKLHDALPVDTHLRERLRQTIDRCLSSSDATPLISRWTHAGIHFRLEVAALDSAAAPFIAILTHEPLPQTLRLLRILQGTANALLTEPTPTAWMRAACSLLVESGGYAQAWIATLQDGNIELLETASATPNPAHEQRPWPTARTLQREPVAEALDRGHPAFLHPADHTTENDTQIDRVEACEHQSVAAYPLRQGVCVTGVMVVYSHPMQTFEETDREALTNIAELIAQGLDHFARNRSRGVSGEPPRITSTLFEASGEGQMVTDEKSVIIAVNPAMTRMTGYREDELLGQTPILLRSGRHDPAFYASLQSDVETQGCWQGEIWDRCQDGTIKPFWLRILRIPPDVGTAPRYISTYTDVTALKTAEARLEHLAHHDALTNLPNRKLLEKCTEQALARAHRHRQRIALLFLDLDGFKRINDSLGHATGDRLLLAIAERLRHHLRKEDTLARLGGDEFVILIENLQRSEQASIVARQLIRAISRDIRLDGQILNLSASIGIAVSPDHGRTPHEMIENADTAMYRAKASGRNTYQYYTHELTQRTRRQLSLEHHLRSALADQEFHLCYQPLIDQRTNAIVGAEALLRWDREGAVTIPPSEFIPLAEERGLIVPIGKWVLEQACRQIGAWSASDIGPLRVAVNVSGRQLDQRGFTRELDDLLLRHQIRPDLLELEVTETLLLHHDNASGLFEYLSQLGLRLSIDDFGTGYSSLSRLTQLHPNTLKIDQSFIQAALENANAAAITTAIIQMAHSLGLEVVAEGVETPEQLQFLRSRSADLIQGYHFSPPLKVHAFEEWVRKHRSRL
ncbi:putative bifunctional diguanylate cyclase/phosphodiesterase [Acidihalobacter ferrooxydans]|uniref:Diguanylate cyclase n=1 Tax=Acidihalobacter ferrooxydans TaxID=1765967 RepID=A0A1P8UIN2_9GAMM|nr:EAL domain-containing protein [Acidihalobacter ferrooxydans]APZ43690.1 hypothetical protein BW247_11810 [Acidihalobacter ferrooxydans]